MMSKTRKIYQIINDELEDLIPLYEYEDLYKYGNIDKLKRYIETHKSELSGEVLYRVNTALRKSKMLNIDILEIYLLILYNKQYNDISKDYINEFENITQTSYENAYTEVKKRPRKIDFKPLLDGWLYVYIPAIGASYYEYMLGRILQDTKDSKKGIILRLQQNDKETLKKTLQKQQNYFISYNKKNKISGIGGYSGSLDRVTSYIVNKATLEGYKEAGATKVRYIAVIDKRTTGVCRSLDLQVFNITGENKFMRDDGYGNLKEYITKGLESGINLPPVVPPMHACRSMIEYWK